MSSRSRSILGAAALAALAVLMLPDRAAASLCFGDPEAIGLAEATALESEAFAQGDYAGDHHYNALLITCNRRRDFNGWLLDRVSERGGDFPDDLTPRTVRGNYNYMGLPAALPYAYSLSREAGVWRLTLPVQLNFPPRLPEMIDLPTQHEQDLGLDAPGEICEVGATVYNAADVREIDQGYIPWELDPSQIETFKADQRRVGIRTPYESRLDAYLSDQWDWVRTVLYSYDLSYYSSGTSCRVPRDTVVGDYSVLDHLRLFYAAEIPAVWSRAGFEVVPRFVGCEEPPPGALSACDPTVTDAEMQTWEMDNTVWEIDFNLRPFSRPSYTRWLAKWYPMHSGTRAATVAHELGHYFGLDDEYAELDDSERDCNAVLPGAWSEYLMCSSSAAYGGGAKGVYAWIITRRYAVGRSYVCDVDADCVEGQYCEVHPLRRNACTDLKGEGTFCREDRQCSDGLTCLLAPFGQCWEAGSRALGEDCFVGAHCQSGGCSPTAGCVCNDDGDCGAGAYCSFNLLSPPSCEPERAEYERCLRDGQCASPNVCRGLPPVCRADGTKVVGESCQLHGECESRRCSPGGSCVCTADAHCPKGEACRTPLFSANYCD